MATGEYRYRPLSFQGWDFTGLTDAGGALLTNGTSSSKWWLWDLWGTVQLGINGSPMQYNGAGAYRAVLGSAIGRDLALKAQWSVYDVAGTTLFWSQSGLILPVKIPIRTYQRNSSLLHVRPFYVAYDGSTRDSSNSAAYLTITDLQTGTVLLAATPLTPNIAAGRWEGATTIGTGEGQRWRETIQVFRSSDNVLYDTFDCDYIDGG